ncbi:MAG: hypothetical protein FWG34_02160 [Oscillospiraceae bacterium]|nr:hypothetical protein [Oscillospiraceae bacterium]
MKMKKAIFLAFVAAIAMTCFFSCANEDKKNDASSTATDPAAISESENIYGETMENIWDIIPAEDFGGYEFNFIKIENDLWATSDVIVEKETGNGILDEMYRRNKKIEEKYNIRLTETVRDDPYQTLKKSVTAGDFEFDAIYDRTNNLAAISSQAILHNLPDVPNIELNNPWWDSSCIKDLSISGKLYFVTGEANLHYNDDTWILMFNKNMMRDLGLENLYRLVLDGKWTLDKFYDMMTAASADLNGNGEPDFDDRFGLLSHLDVYPAFLFGADERLFSKNSADLPVIELNGSNFASKFIKVCEMLSDKNMTAIWQRDSYIFLGGDEWTWQNIFFEGRALLFAEVLGTLHLSNMRNMQENFGLLPVPKYDENQADYISTVLASTLALGVPSNAENPERTGLILEALSAESYSSVIPVYYDVALQYKLTRDEESVKMLDIIRKVRRYDLGSVYGFGSVAFDTANMMMKNDQNIASYVEKAQSKAEKSINAIIGAYEN